MKILWTTVMLIISLFFSMKEMIDYGYTEYDRIDILVYYDIGDGV